MSETACLNPIRYCIIHETEYPACGVAVSLAQHLLHLMPRALPHQTLGDCHILIEPDQAALREGLDAFGNPVAWLALETPHDGLLVRAESDVTVHPRPVPDLAESPPWEMVRDGFNYRPGLRSPESLEAQRYLYASPRVPCAPALAQLALEVFTPEAPVLQAAEALMALIFEDFTFDPEASEVGSSVFDVLERKRGVCQDFAHLMIAALRSIGLPARYMSGYLLTAPPPGKPRLIGADASHAWVAVWCPQHGWVEFDPTNNIRPGLHHVTLGWGRDFQDVSPLRGVILGGVAQNPEVRVTVMPWAEMPEGGLMRGPVPLAEVPAQAPK